MAKENVPTEDLTTKKIFTTGEAAVLCKVSQQTIIRCFDSGRLTGFRVPGSRFRRIPRDELIRFMRMNGIPTDILSGGARKKILIVEDDERITEVFEDVLRQDGRFETKVATTGYDAGLMTESFRPDLIILDYLLPDINGNVVCKRVRETDHLQGTKILVISGVVNQAEVEQLMAAGADLFLRKPFDIATLISKIDELLRSKKGAEKS